MSGVKPWLNALSWRVRRGVLPEALGIIDQGSLAAASFVSTVLVGRTLEPDQFGVFAVAFAVLVLAERMQHGLIGAPLLAIPVDREVSGVTGPIWALQWRLMAVIAVVVALGAIPGTLFLNWPGAGGAAIALLPALVGTQARDLGRYLSYRSGKTHRAALIGILSALIQVAGLGIAAVTGHLDVFSAILILGLGAAAAFAVSLPWSSFQLGSAAGDVELKRAIWSSGRWLALSNMVFWGATQLFLFVSAALLGPASAGIFRAAQSVLGPTQFMVSGLFNSLLPTVAEHLASGKGTWESVRHPVTVIGGAVGIYCLVVASFPDTALTLLFGVQYAGHGPIVQMLAGGYLMTGLAGAMVLVLVVLHRTDLILRGHVMALGVSLLAALPLIEGWGLLGAAAGLSLVYASRFVVLAMLAKSAAHARHRDWKSPMSSNGEAL